MFQGSNKIIVGLGILLLPLILQVSFGEEPLLDVNVTLEKHIVFPGDEFWYDMRISNNGNELLYNVTIKMNMTGPGKISPNQGLNCLPKKTNLIFCNPEINIHPGKFIDRSFAIEVDPAAPFDSGFSSHFEVSAESNNNPNDVNAVDNISEPILPKSSQAFLSAGISEGNGLPPNPGQSFSMFILAKNNGPTVAESVELHFRISGPGVISKLDLPANCFVFDDPHKVMCTEKVIPSGIFAVKEIPILVDFDAQNGESFRIEAWVWAGSNNDPIQEYDFVSWEGLQVTSSIPNDGETELQNRIEEQQRIKTLQELENLKFTKLLILNAEESVFRYISSTSDDKFKIIIAQKQYLEAKMDYIQIFQKYLDIKPPPKDAERKELDKLILELEMEYEKFANERLFIPISPKVPNPIIENLTDFEKPEPVPEKKETTVVYNLRKEFKNSPEAAEKYAKSVGLDYNNGKTKILVKEINSNQLPRLEEIGATIESFDGNMVQVEIPISNLEKMRELEFIEKLIPPSIAIPTGTGKFTSQGVKIVNADLVHKEGQTGGFTGKGVKVAVLDVGFDKDNPEISDNIVDKESFRYGSEKSLLDLKGKGYEFIHGSSVAEIIVDVAPDVELYLYSMGSEPEFTKAVEEAIFREVDIISMSALWPGYPTDGTSKMTKKIEEAISKGITFVVASGNWAETHWEGKYKDDDNDGLHEFSGQDEGMTINVPQGSEGSRIKVYLLWNSTNGSIYDFDLTLTDPKGDPVVFSSDQSLSLKDSSENFDYSSETYGDYSFQVSYSGTETPDATLEVFSIHNSLEYSHSLGSVAPPTDAKGAIVVGAVRHMDLLIEPFSSRGPTNDGTIVPTLVAPDLVITKNMNPFEGTSASAPHVAGIVALMLEKDESLTPAEIKNILETNADRSTIPHVADSYKIFGHGIANSGFLISGNVGESIPAWIKNNAGWWAEGIITDADFIQGIQYLIKNGIILIPQTQQETSNAQEIPEWIKNNAGWWAEGTITDEDFIQGIQFLVKNGIIQL